MEKITQEFTNARKEIVTELKGITLTQQMQVNTTKVNMDLKRKVNNWKNNFDERKLSYWKSLKNRNLSDIYKKWAEETPPTIPRKFLPHPIRGELENQYQRRLILSIEKMKCEADTMRIRAEHHKTIYETIDRGIREEIEDKFENDHDLKLKLLELWRQECQEQETISQNSWNEKEQFFRKIKLEEIPHTNETNKEDTPNHMFRNHQYQATSASRNANNRSGFKPPLSRVNRGNTGRMTQTDKFKGQKNQWSNTPRDSNRHQNYIHEIRISEAQAGNLKGKGRTTETSEMQQAGNLNERNRTTETSEMQQTGNLIGETLNRDCTVTK